VAKGLCFNSPFGRLTVRDRPEPDLFALTPVVSRALRGEGC
jgi:hypothetical protein